MYRQLFLLILAMLAARTFAGVAASPLDPNSPRGALKAYSDALPGGGTTAALQAYYAANDRERAVARSFARADIAAATLEQLTRKKFGDKAADDIVHAMRERTDTDIADALEKITGDHAAIEWADGKETLEMVKVDGKWKVPVWALIDPEETAENVLKTADAFADALEESVKQFQAGEYANAYLLERSVKQRVYRILGPDGLDD